MTTWHPDICDCEIRLGGDGEPLEFVGRCERHKDAEPADVATECRRKEAAREAVREALALPEAPDWVRSDDGEHVVVLPDGLDKTARARVEAAVARQTNMVTVATRGEVDAARG